MRDGDNTKLQDLGLHLKALRARAKESLVDASGAVEIDVMELDSIEKGYKKPAEDILLLLISHFNAKEDEAMHLWEMAGYGAVQNTYKDISGNNASYTDSVEVIATKQGVMMNFMLGGKTPTKTLGKFGMSREHAKKLAEAIIEALKRTEE